jgi:hypothetical protein
MREAVEALQAFDPPGFHLYDSFLIFPAVRPLWSAAPHNLTDGP